jgi:predicted unusual protein kinase regulating ubiquinone biosynthesis (AarF/ABC1/UbiB family)
LIPLELDFINEGRNSEAIAEALAHRGDVFSPPVVWEHTTRHVLVSEFVEAAKVSDVERLRRLGLEPARVAERVVDIWGEQVLRLGHFHADPHPGNILVMPDGRLCLIDFGLTARLPEEARAAVGRLVVAATDQNPMGMMAAFESLGFHSAEDGPTAYAGLGGNLLSRGGDPEKVNVRIARALRRFRMEGVPGEVLLIMRVLGLLSGLSARLGRSGTAMPVWRRYADEPVAASA